MKRLRWIIHNWREVWRWAGVYTQMLKVPTPTMEHFAIQTFVEFEVPGMVAPYDRMRLEGGCMSSCGTAKMAMSLHVFNEEWGGWNGGCIGHKDLARIRDFINIHLDRIEQMPAAEQYRLQQNLVKRRELKRGWNGDDVILSDDILTDTDNAA